MAFKSEATSVVSESDAEIGTFDETEGTVRGDRTVEGEAVWTWGK